MVSPENIRAWALLTNSGPELVEAFDSALDGGLLRDVDTCPVRDANGNFLIRDGRYRLKGSLIRITDWKFGSGNMLDRYYYVWYIDSELKSQRMSVGAKYPNGALGGAEYLSSLEPVE